MSFEKLLTRHAYNVKPGAVFEVGEGWEMLMRQASAALAGLPDKAWILGATKDAGALDLRIVAEDGAGRETVEGAKEIQENARRRSLSICEECGQPGSLRGVNVRCEEHLVPRTVGRTGVGTKKPSAE